jgi:hypothetical protein
VLYLGSDAGVQWRIRPIFFRVERELDWKTSWHGTVYLEGDELAAFGKRIRRTVYVIKEGLRRAQTRPPPARTQPRGRRRDDALAVLQ